MEYTYEFLRKCHGLRFRAKSYGVPEEGIVKVDDAYVLLCYGKESLNFPESFNRRVTRMVDEEMPVIDSDFNDFEIVPRDPETYKDWQMGDNVHLENSDCDFYEIIFRSGRLVGVAALNVDDDESLHGMFTCDELFRKGYRLVLTDIENQIIEEKKKAEWKPQDGDVCYLESVYEWIFIQKGDECLSLPYVCLRKDGFFEVGGSRIALDYSIRELRPATDEEKQRLFDAMAKNGKRWNAEKKVVEDIPEETKTATSDFTKFAPVLVRNSPFERWRPGVFYYMQSPSYFPFIMVDETDWTQCLPLNEKTMHLLGTNDDYEEEQS